MLYKDLADLYDALGHSPKRLEKTHLMSNFLKNADENHLNELILLLRGSVFALHDEQKLGFSEKLLIKAVCAVAGATEKQFVASWRKLGDIGEVTASYVAKKTQTTLFATPLTIQEVFTSLQKLAFLEGSGSTDAKIKLLSKLLANASAKEAKYIARTVLSDLRIGASNSTLRDAIAWAFLLKQEDINYDGQKKAISPENREEYNVIINKVQTALDKSNDFTKVIFAAKKGISQVESIKITPHHPLNVMLAQKQTTFEDAFKKVGTPCAVEYKLDGFRLQINKTEDKITLFTRSLENVTNQFPDVISLVKEHVLADSCILDAEAVGIDPKTKKHKPFQEISQRIKRKHNIQEIAQKLPVELDVFDILYYNDEETIGLPFSKRRELLQKAIKPKVHQIALALQKIVSSQEEANDFYQTSLSLGYEGIMIKKLDAPYKPGSRVGTMIKFKPVQDGLDLVIIGAEWGTGKRSGWLTSFTVACYDPNADAFLSLGKVGTGIKEKQDSKQEFDATFEELTQKLKPFITDTSGRNVTITPTLVVEIAYEEIQASKAYESGYALRFPRFVRLRPDREPDGIANLTEIEGLYGVQRGRG